jgi:hypothetical protein
MSFAQKTKPALSPTGELKLRPLWLQATYSESAANPLVFVAEWLEPQGFSAQPFGEASHELSSHHLQQLKQWRHYLHTQFLNSPRPLLWILPEQEQPSALWWNQNFPVVLQRSIWLHYKPQDPLQDILESSLKAGVFFAIGLAHSSSGPVLPPSSHRRPFYFLHKYGVHFFEWAQDRTRLIASPHPQMKLHFAGHQSIIDKLKPCPMSQDS